jgi:D-serine deaminase-like pyridoxal phosphate-dependent protein
MNVYDLPTPSLIVDGAVFEGNVATMSAALPGERLRPHVKAFKSTALARRLADAGHRNFCCATVKEMEGMAGAGLGDDLLLANEVVGPAARRLGELVRRTRGSRARITVAVDSPETIAAAADSGIEELLIDVCVGLPRCGCPPDDAAALADEARRRGLTVRGVMGYEGHLMREQPAVDKAAKVEEAMTVLTAAHAAVGGDVVSAGGTGTYDCNPWATEIQAGSYALMDTEYVPHAPAFGIALVLWTTVISVYRPAGWAVLDGGLKCLGMDHGNPTVVGGQCFVVSDEHITYFPDGPGGDRPRVGDRVRVLPAHVDPTVALHERMYVVDGEDVVDTWEVDLRNW